MTMLLLLLTLWPGLRGPVSEVPSQRFGLRGFTSEVPSQRFRLRGLVSEVPSQRSRLTSAATEAQFRAAWKHADVSLRLGDF